METEAEKPTVAEPGKEEEEEEEVKYDDVEASSSSCFCADVKPDAAAVDDWEAIATDEEKGETAGVISLKETTEEERVVVTSSSLSQS